MNRAVLYSILYREAAQSCPREEMYAESEGRLGKDQLMVLFVPNPRMLAHG